MGDDHFRSFKQSTIPFIHHLQGQLNNLRSIINSPQPRPGCAFSLQRNKNLLRWSNELVANLPGLLDTSWVKQSRTCSYFWFGYLIAIQISMCLFFEAYIVLGVPAPMALPRLVLSFNGTTFILIGGLVSHTLVSAWR